MLTERRASRDRTGRTFRHTPALPPARHIPRSDMGFGNAEELPYVDGTDPIYRAAENGDALKLKRALAGIASKRDRWAAANVRNEDAGDKSPLHIAASRGYMLMATDLLDAGAELLPDEKGRTPLHLGAANDDKDMVTLLLKRTKDKFKAKTQFCEGYSRPAAPVHLCKRPDIRKMLIFKGCGDEGMGKARVVLGDAMEFKLSTPVKAFIGLFGTASILFIRSRIQIAQGYQRPTRYVR